MKNSLYNRKHLREYLLYGFWASIAYIVPVWVFFFFLDYNQTFIIFLGSILFMFVIMLYVIKLSKRRPEYKSSWMMIIASHCAVLAGIALSVLFTTILCFIYIPGFLSGRSPNVLADAPAGLNNQNWSLLTVLYFCATVENFGAGGFIAVLGPYVFKKNQTKDKTALLERDIKPSKA
jgi:ABC-type Fe3+-siderophore transport system permease subunit